MYNTGWVKSRRALDCFFTFMAEILQGYWQILDRSGKKIILLSPLVLCQFLMFFLGYRFNTKTRGMPRKIGNPTLTDHMNSLSIMNALNKARRMIDGAENLLVSLKFFWSLLIHFNTFFSTNETFWNFPWYGLQFIICNAAFVNTFYWNRTPFFQTTTETCCENHADSGQISNWHQP